MREQQEEHFNTEVTAGTEVITGFKIRVFAGDAVVTSGMTTCQVNNKQITSQITKFHAARHEMGIKRIAT